MGYHSNSIALVVGNRLSRKTMAICAVDWSVSDGVAGPAVAEEPDP